MHKKIEFVEIGKIFTAIKLEKHYSLCNHTQSAVDVGRPGDYLVLDSFYNVMIFNRQDFRKAFGHKRMELLDEP